MPTPFVSYLPRVSRPAMRTHEMRVFIARSASSSVAYGTVLFPAPIVCLYTALASVPDKARNGSNEQSREQPSE